MLLKAEVELDISAIDLGGWDTYFAQGLATGWMPSLMNDLAGGLADVLSEILVKRLNNPATDEIFPGHRVAYPGMLSAR